MKELIDFALSPPVVFYTVLLLIFLFYWFTVIIGVLDIGSFDFDIDVDADVDVDVGVDVEAGGGGAGIALSILGFFNFGKMPFMVLMSILSLSLWSIGILGNFYWGGSMPFSIAFFPINLLVSLAITKTVTTPLIPVFKAFNDELKQMRYVGMLAKVTSRTSANTFGKVELWTDNSFLTLKVKAVPEFDGVIERGTEVVITGSNEIETIFFVRPTTF